MPIDKLNNQKEISEQWKAALLLCKICSASFKSADQLHSQEKRVKWASWTLDTLLQRIKDIPAFMAFIKTRELRATEIKQLTEFKIREFEAPTGYRPRRCIQRPVEQKSSGLGEERGDTYSPPSLQGADGDASGWPQKLSRVLHTQLQMMTKFQLNLQVAEYVLFES